MPYPPLQLPPAGPASAAISQATERYLEQAHYLLARTHGTSFNDHFGLSAVIMTLLSIAAASAILNFDPKTNKRRLGPTDKGIFTSTVVAYFPWNDVVVIFDQAPTDPKQAAAEELYGTIRNPLIHIGGIVSRKSRRLSIIHPFPGLPQKDSDAEIDDWSSAKSLFKQCLMHVRTDRTDLHSKVLYWCARRMIEVFAADQQVQADIEARLGTSKP